eukprot:258029_1
MLSCFTNSAPCGIELSVSFLSAVDICIWKLIWTQYLSAVDSVLSLTNSPYHEVSDVVISEGATFSIPNGGIIFNDDYDINVRGTINAGCYDIDTSTTNKRYTSILNSIDGTRQGSIRFDGYTDAYGYFHVVVSAMFCSKH